MTDVFEQELRSVLADRAETLPAAARERLAQIDYRPDGSRLRASRCWSLVGTAGTGLAAAVAAAIVLLSSGGSALVPLAYAGYSASPSTPTAAELKPAIEECKPWLRPSSNNAGYPGRLVLTDKRGDYVVALYAIGPDTQGCIVDGDGFSGGFGGAGVLEGNPAPGRGQLGMPAGGAIGAPGFPGGGVAREAYGLAGGGVTAVTFVFAHHRTVAATVEHGWYFAWWPEPVPIPPISKWHQRNPVAVRVTTGSGTTTSPMSFLGKTCEGHQSGCVFRLHGPTWTTIHHVY